MKLLFSFCLFLSCVFVSADTAKIDINENTNAAELTQFRHNAMDAVDNPHCRSQFKRYFKKKNPKVFIYVPRKKDRTGYCKLALKTAASGDTLKKTLERCEKQRKRAKKNPFISSCKVFARNNNLLITRDDFGLKPVKKDIFYVAERYGVDEVKKSLESNIDINDKNKLGLTPLHIAVKEDNREIVKYLISQGADLKLKNKRGEDALILATTDNHLEIFEYLLSQNADITVTTAIAKRQPVHIAAQYGFIGILEVLFNKGVDVDQTTAYDETPLKLAIKSHFKPVVKYIIEKGADINAKDKTGKTPLDFARKYKNNRIIDFLIENGAKPADSL